MSAAQIGLFDQPQFVPGASRRTDPETSTEAAQSVDASNLERVVLDCLKARGPSILDEVIALTKLDKVTASPRFKPLEDAGKIARTGIKRPGKAGRPQTEWKAL